jgi:non-ribosomal peptide synthetase component E (peptide arylation enzyme)
MAVFDPAYFRAQGWWRDETLGDWLDRCVADAPNRPAVLSADRTLSYAAFGADVARFAAGFADAGIRRGA